MLRLLLLRHAKSQWGSPDLADADRPLNERGERDAPEMGRRLAAAGLVPARVLCSPAVRAETTARLVLAQMAPAQPELVLEKGIYDASPARLLDILTAQPDAVTPLMLVGHNPGLTELANRLGRDLHIDNIPTCGVVCLDFEIESWRQLTPYLGRLVLFDRPS